MSQSPKDLEQFIASQAYYDPEHPKSPEHNYILVDDLRAWMDGHVLVPEELIKFIEAKEHHLPIEDRRVLNVMLNAGKGEQ